MQTMDTPTVEQGLFAQYLTFHIGEEECGVSILQVKEIVGYRTTTAVPGTPPWIRGVINVRGSVVPVVDLAVKFGLEVRDVTKRTCVVIVDVEIDGELTAMGVVADAVDEVLDLRVEDIEDAPAFGTGVRVDYLQGLARIEDRFVLVLDIDKVLQADELAALISVKGKGHAAEDAEDASEADEPAADAE